MTSGVLTPERRLGPSAAWSARGRAVLRGPIEARTWHAVGYLILGLPLAAVGFGVELASTFAGLLLALTFLGFPIIALGGLLAVRLGGYQRRLAANLLGEHVPAPAPRTAPRGFFGWLQSRLTDPRDWRARLYLLIHFPLNAAAVYVIAILYLEGVIGTFYPFLWQVSGPVQHYRGNGLLDAGYGFDSARSPAAAAMPHRFTLHAGGVFLDTWPRALVVMVVGIVVLLVVPWLARGFARLDVVLVRALLGTTEGSRRVERLEAARGVVAEDAAATLRRIERDLHDGTQAQLVALAMNLGELKERLAADEQADERLVSLVTTSHARAKEALAELRGIAGGIHPPALDLGLDHALATLAARSVVPAVLQADLPTRPSDAVATIAYYSAAELLANVAKHSGAEHATITVAERAGRLILRVADNGRGGALPGRGTGLSGLSERLDAVDGSLDLHSPPGGPTVVTVGLPLRI